MALGVEIGTSSRRFSTEHRRVALTSRNPCAPRYLRHSEGFDRRIIQGARWMCAGLCMASAVCHCCYFRTGSSPTSGHRPLTMPKKLQRTAQSCFRWTADWSVVPPVHMLPLSIRSCFEAGPLATSTCHDESPCGSPQALFKAGLYEVPPLSRLPKHGRNFTSTWTMQSPLIWGHITLNRRKNWLCFWEPSAC